MDLGAKVELLSTNLVLSLSISTRKEVTILVVSNGRDGLNIDN
jgi:hypothetical protein